MRGVATVAVALAMALAIMLLLGEAQPAAGRWLAPVPAISPLSESEALLPGETRATVAPVLLHLWGPPSPVRPGDRITVDLLLDNADPLFGVDLTVGYSTDLLSVEGLLPGPLFPEGHRYIMKPDPPTGPGRVRYVSTLLGEAAPSASTGVIATLLFRVVREGSAGLWWDEAALRLSDRESNPLAWRSENSTVQIPTPTATATPPRDSGGSGSSGAGAPEATDTPKPAPTSTLPPTATRTPRATSTPEPPDRRQAAPGDDGYLSPLSGNPPRAGSGNPLFAEPTLGPTVALSLPGEPPTGVPPVSGDGRIALLGPVPGVGLLSIPLGDSRAEFRVDNQGEPLAVRVQPAIGPPAGFVAPPDIVVVRVFSLDLYSFDAGIGSATLRQHEDGDGAAPVVLKYRLGAEDFYRSLGEDGAAHPGRFLFFRISPEGRLAKLATVWTPNPAPYGTLTALLGGRSTFMLALLPPEREGQTLPADPRYFRETGFRVDRDDFWDYFQKRGGVGSFGYPVSREFLLEGFLVQLFQRALLQAMPDGSVATMNLLDSGLMPYVRINSSTFPAPDPDLIAAAPLPSDPDYADRAVAFVRATVPDRWEGLPVAFQSGFFSRVRLGDAFPDGGGDPSLLPLLNLEMWGLPTSMPAYDPHNHSFVYQRFQRGILHFDAGSGMTQGLLLGDYLKGVMTGRDLPTDLELEARGHRLYRQYRPESPSRGESGRVSADSSLWGAFEIEAPEEIVVGEAAG